MERGPDSTPMMDVELTEYEISLLKGLVRRHFAVNDRNREQLLLALIDATPAVRFQSA